jgi:hypothetical protein
MTMYVLGCGSRTWSNRQIIANDLRRVINAQNKVEGTVKVIHGGARGADTMFGDQAHLYGLEVKVFPADWDTHGLSAGPKRNQQMLQFLLDKATEGHRIFAFAYATPDLKTSRGTADMVRRLNRNAITTVIREGDPHV